MRWLSVHAGESGRLAAVAVMLLPFLAAQLAWLPLGAFAGQWRQVESWSLCGEALCDCLPDPEPAACSLCPEGDASACPRVSSTRTDTSGSDDFRVAVLSLLSSIVAVPGGAGDEVRWASPRRWCARVAAVESPASRVLETPTPPPNA